MNIPQCVSGVCEHTSHQMNSLWVVMLSVAVLLYTVKIVRDKIKS